MRRSLHYCISQWKQYSLVSASAKNSSLWNLQLVHTHGTRQTQTRMVASLNSAERFHSQGCSLGPEKKEHLANPLVGAPAPNELQSHASQTHRSSLFLEHLQHCGSPSDVLDLTCEYTPRQVSNCLMQMWASIKKMSDEKRRCELQLMFEHPAFEMLLQNAMMNVGSIRNDSMAYSLLAMVNLGVPQRSRVVHVYLRTCQEKLNDFDEKSLSILSSVLEVMESSPNVDALKHGLRMVIATRLPQITNVVALQTAMRLLGKDTSLDLKRKLEQKALSMTDQFSPPNTQYMISTMAKMGFYSKPLLQICSEKIADSLHGVPLNRLLTVLQSFRELRYRDRALFTSISDYIASTVDIWSQKEVILFLSVFESLAFCPAALMAAFAEKVITNPDALTLKDLLCVLKVYSSLNCDLQQNREQFLQSVSQAVDAYLPKMSAYDLLKTCYYLCLLGHFPSAPLEKLLQGSTLEVLRSREKQHRRQEHMFQTVHLCLHLDQPVLPRPLSVPPPMLGDVPANDPPVKLLQLLPQVLGDRADVALQEMVVAENLYFIDAVISKPVANQSEEACSQAEQTERIAVLCPAPSAFCFGTSTPRGPLAVKLRHLKVLGYFPILITEQELKSEEEAAELLRAQIFPGRQTLSSTTST
ncbi:FAST kinase domain-containing protein 2, mitochondrial isoform X2 [Dunckerocampus dactyliophorus]|uniref:FAST kinase domain-containing protein 2, mitochondrial isoform X2 n=1 Tax=Dunckerocampus dactyliophorus TaxID=161453 RepID=UPI002405E547|nr:FAST kinase domain-containing protein 2, mitochondrial isoform X2 [Dunckerocampus dactyliophorus]